MRQPWFKFFPTDWRADPALKSCSLAARGLWMEMLGIMHEAEPRGHLLINGQPVTPTTLSALVGAPKESVVGLLAELEAAGVFSRRKNGTIVSRRMERDVARTMKAKANGNKGGSRLTGVQYNKPGFIYAFRRESDGAIKIGISANPQKRLYRVRENYRGDQIGILYTAPVDDMGGTEAFLHDKFKRGKTGEWFAMNQGEERELRDWFISNNQVPLKGNPYPHIPEARSQSLESPPTTSSSTPPGAEAPSGGVVVTMDREPSINLHMRLVREAVGGKFLKGRDRLGQWLKAWPDPDWIVEHVRDAFGAAQTRQDEPSSYSYFEKGLAKAWADRSAPMPVVEPGAPQTVPAHNRRARHGARSLEDFGLLDRPISLGSGLLAALARDASGDVEPGERDLDARPDDAGGAVLDLRPNDDPGGDPDGS